jgi:hypothetical protein
VIDVVATRECRHDQRQDLVPGVGTAGLRSQVQALVDQPLETEVMSQRSGQDQPGIGHQAVIVEGRVESVEAVR